MITATSQTGRLLKAFKEHRQLTNRQIVEKIGSFRYSARIAELRSEGHVILCERVKQGLFRYTYMGLKEDVELQEKLDEVVNNPKKFDNLKKAIKSWLS